MHARIDGSQIKLLTRPGQVAALPPHDRGACAEG
jgi:hypothetical protein